MDKIIVFDIECYPNYFLINFKKDSKYYKYEVFNNEIIVGDFNTLMAIYKAINNDHFIVSYNGNTYDLPLFKYYLDNALKKDINKLLKEKSDALVGDKVKYIYIKENSIDILPLLYNVPKTAKSLKLLGCAIKHPKLQDLPIHHTQTILESDLELMRLYCDNDVNITESIFKLKEIQEMLAIRSSMQKQYNLSNDIYSKSDSAADNLIWKSWYTKLFGEVDFKKLGTDRGIFKFNEALTGKVPNSFITEEGKNIVKILGEQTFKPSNKDIKKTKAEKDEDKYPSFDVFGLHLQFGKGGIHSKDKPTFYNTEFLSSQIGEKVRLMDWDI